MFARVITAQAAPGQLDGAIALARDQLPAAAQRRGFRGFYLLTDAETGRVMTISLWDTQEQLDAVEAEEAEIRREEAPSLGAPSMSVETYEVTLTA
ncbi:MAG TPA: antibiotic biosynthesis monooxygenase [Streptosporangiaceae bacterium]|jgi:heme-degrading monooxygenase HmoA